MLADFSLGVPLQCDVHNQRSLRPLQTALLHPLLHTLLRLYRPVSVSVLRSRHPLP